MIQTAIRGQMQAPAHRATTSEVASAQLVREAFRDLHGTRLHGFALLLMLGDRRLAARLASEALAAGGARTGELRHPERAAAWLRHRVTRGARRAGRSPRDPDPACRRALESLGVDAAAFAGLAALTPRERAALIADSIERLDRRDTAKVVDLDGPRLDRLIQRARGRYVTTVADALDDGSFTDGPTPGRVRAVAARALS